MDARFEKVLTPFAPNYRREFLQSLAKPSTAVLQLLAPRLEALRHALETYFHQLDTLKAEHARCLDAIQDAEENLVIQAYPDDVDISNESASAMLDGVSAQHYEHAQKAWTGFLRYATDSPAFVQIGVFLVDQRQLIAKIHSHATMRMDELDNALPGLYKLFLRDLLHEVDGKIDKVTKIPTSFDDANEWLTHVMEMLPSHAFRQRFDAKCANVARLQRLLHELQSVGKTNILSASDGADDSLRKLELEWAATFDTLMVCLSRVQDRDSEHRRSFFDLASKTEEYVTTQLDHIRSEFGAVPILRLSNSSNHTPDSRDAHADFIIKQKERELSVQKARIVQKLESLVDLDSECKSVQRRFAAYEREFRAIEEHRQSGSADSFVFSEIQQASSAPAETQKLPSEVLLQQIVVAIDLRKWYDSWTQLVGKWETTPLSLIHPGTVQSRIRQFRRRLLYASSRLFRSGVGGIAEQKDHRVTDDPSLSFLSKDLELTCVFERSVEEMAGYCKIFEALAGSSFTETRWQTVDEMLRALTPDNSSSNPREQLSLRVLKEHWGAQHPEQVKAFQDVCDLVVVESKVHTRIAQARQRLDQLTVSFIEENYNIRCENIQDVLLHLEDLLLDVKLYLHEQNPELGVLLALCGEVESKIVVCEHIEQFQGRWLLVCEMAKLHDTDEFFSSHKPASSAKTNIIGDKTQEMSLQWAAFKSASIAWNDRVRRAFCTNTKDVSWNTSYTAGQQDPPAREVAESNVVRANCSLNDIVTAFDGFDFEQCASSCEAGAQLLGQYFNTTREIAPRLYALTDSELLQLLVREDDIKQIRHSLAVCFPHVDAFTIGTAEKRESASSIDEDEPPREKAVNGKESSERGSGPIVIRGIESAGLLMHSEFNLPVLKIGRVKFWFARLEEELKALVTTHVGRSVQTLLGDGYSMPVSSVVIDKKLCQELLPQSITLALNLRFRYHMDRSLAHYHTHQEQRQQSQRALGGQSALRCKVIDELKQQTERSVNELASTLKKPPSGLIRADPRVESVILLCFHHLHIIRHMTDLLQQDQEEQAVLFWSMQLKIGAALEPSTRSMSKTGLSDLESKLLGFQTGQPQPDAPATRNDNGSGLVGVLFHAQVAHVEVAIGHEFIGCARLVVITPLTERCVFAIFSAMRAHSLAMLVPYTEARHRQEEFSLLSAISQVLMKPSFVLRCGANAQTLGMVERLTKAAVALGGFLTVQHILELPPSLRSACREKLVQSYHQCHGRHLHQPSVHREGSAAIFVPLAGETNLRASGLLYSLLTPFRALAVVLPSVPYVVEAMLLVEGFALDQVVAVGLGAFFEGYAAAEADVSRDLSVYRLVSSVIKEARRLRSSFSAVSTGGDVAPLAKQLSFVASRRRSVNLKSAGTFDTAVEQRIFETAIRNVVVPVLTQCGCDALTQRCQLLLSTCLPLSSSQRLVADRLRGGQQEEDVAGALTICLERSSLVQSEKQLDLMLDMWRAMQCNQAIAIYGPSGSGKTTCIKILHHALRALEFAGECVGDGDTPDRSSSETTAAVTQSELIVMNPRLFSMDELYGIATSASPTRRSAAGLLRQMFASPCSPSASSYANQTRTWVLLDDAGSGISTSWLEPLLGLFSESTRWLHLLDGTSVMVSQETSNRVRLIFESVDLMDVSPRLLVDCWSVHVPSSSVTHTHILQAWRQSWEQRITLSSESMASSNLATVFSTMDLLVSTICVRFINDEVGRLESTDASSDEQSRDEAPIELRLGLLSIRHMTQTAIKLVTSLVLAHRALLEELSHTQVSLMVCFSVIWGFSGHLSDAMRLKLELFIRSQGKHFAELKHLTDLPGSIASGDHFARVWEMLHPLQYRPGLDGSARSGESEVGTTSGKTSSERLVLDPASGRFIVLAPAVRSLVRICSQLLRFPHSFLFIGSSAAGKTSLLRLLKLLNEEDEAAEEMVDASIDLRQSHGVLDWLKMPAAWFCPARTALDASGARAKFKEEAQLFAPRRTYATLFLDDLGANVSATCGAGEQEEFVRFLLDHQLTFSRNDARFMPMDKAVGAAMRVDDAPNAHLPSSLVRLMRHFMVFRVPNYDRKQLLSIFRSKFQAHFQGALTGVAAASNRGRRGSGGVPAPGERLLSMEETALRASVDLAVEFTAAQQFMHKAVDVSTGGAAANSVLVFNLHHASALLERTLSFAGSLRAQQQSGTNSTSLLTLGKLQQAWMSEIRNMFLANLSAMGSTVSTQHRTRPAARVKTAAVGSPGKLVHDQRSESVPKIWSALRLISEKYFSVSLHDDLHTLASIEDVYFALQLTSKYSQLSVGEQLSRLREVMTANASSSSSLARSRTDSKAAAISNSKQNGAPQVGEPTSEALQRVLLHLASSASWSSSSPPVRTYRPDDLSTLEVKLLTGSSYGLNKTLHLLHALDEQRHIVISAQASRSVAESLLRFACDSHGLQVKRINSKQTTREQDETLRAILHAAVIQNERMALWIDCGGSELCSVDGSHALFDLVAELCLHQVPSMVFRSGALRDAAVLSFVQSRQHLEIASEWDVLHNFVERVQRNIRLCIFADSGAVNSTSSDHPYRSVGSSRSALLNWLTTRERFQWFYFECVENVDDSMSEIARVAIDMVSVCAPPHAVDGTAEEAAGADSHGVEAGTKPLAVSVCLQIHALLTDSMVEPLSECFQLNYFLSFLKNVVVLHQRRLQRVNARAAQCRNMLSTLATKRQHFHTLITRKSALEERLNQLRCLLPLAAESAEQHRSSVQADALKLRRQRESATNDECNVEVNARRAARNEQVSWAYRALCEETNLEIVEVETELSAIAECLRQWDAVSAVETEAVVAWEQELEKLLQRRTHTKLLADSLFQSALTAYSYASSLPSDKLAICTANVKKVVSALYTEEDGEAMDPFQSSILLARADDASTETTVGDDSDEDDDRDASLAKSIWSAQFPFLHRSNALQAVGLADTLCDRLPIFVDQSGLLQRFFIHFFSGHSLFSSPVDEKDSTAVSHTAMIVMCEDEKLTAKLHEAQRKDIPVLVINLEHEHALPQLLPFLEYLSGHKRQPLLSQLTVHSYQTQVAEQDARKTKKRHSTAGVPNSLAAVPVSPPIVSGGESDSKPQRKKAGAGVLSTDIAAAAVAAMAVDTATKGDDSTGQQPVHSHPQHERSSGTSSPLPPSASRNQQRVKGPSGFQVYAVSPRPIPIQVQHALAMHLAVFTISLETQALQQFFQDVWVRENRPKLHLAIREVESAQLESAHRCEQLEKQLSELLLSTPASVQLKPNSVPWIRAFFHHLQLVPQTLDKLSNDKRRHRTDMYLLHERRDTIVKEANAYTSVANEFASIASSLTALSTLAGTSSQLYAHSLRWVECAIERQLELLDSRYRSTRRLEFVVDQGELVRCVVTETTQDLVSGYASASHRHIFLFLLAVEREAQRTGQRTAYKRVVELLSGSSSRAGFLSERRNECADDQITLAATSSASTSRDAVNRDTSRMGSAVAAGSTPRATEHKSRSMVDRFRRKVRLCTFVFDRLSSSRIAESRQKRSEQRGVTHGEAAGVSAIRNQRVHTGSATAVPLRASASTATPPRTVGFQERAEELLSGLLTAVDSVWSDWRQGKAQTRQDVQCVLQSLGIQRGRFSRRTSQGVVDTPVQSSSIIALVDQEDVYGQYGMTQGERALEASDSKRFEKQMGRLLITKMYFPDFFADAMSEYIESEAALEEREVICTSSPLPLQQPLEPRDSLRGLSTHTSATAALVSDVALSRRHERIHPPALIIAYDDRERNRAEIVLSSWRQASSGVTTVHHCDGAELRERLTELVTSKEKIVVELLAADHFDRVVSLVSQLINQHTLLSPPQWNIITALSVASRIRSSLMPLISKSVIVRHEATDPSALPNDVKRWLVDRGVSESFASRWVNRELLDSVREPTGAARFPVPSDLAALAAQFKALDDIVAVPSPERGLLERALIELTATTSIAAASTGELDTPRKMLAEPLTHGRETESSSSFAKKLPEGATLPPSAARRNRASSSAVLLSDLMLLRRSMSLVAPEVMVVKDRTLDVSTGSTSSPLDDDNPGAVQIPERVHKLYGQVGSLYHLLRDEIASRALLSPTEQEASFSPWSTLEQEFGAHFRAFTSVNKSFEALRHESRRQADLSIVTQQQITSLANGLIPFEWMELAFTHTVGPSTSISIPQLVLLVTCRLGMLVNCLCNEPQHAINLAVLSDARAFLSAMKTHCASEWSTPVDDLVLVLEIDTQESQADSDQQPSAKSSTSDQKQSSRRLEARSSALDAAIVKDARGFPCGFRVDGLVAIEQSDTSMKRQQTTLYSLPLCRLYCIPERELAALEKNDKDATQKITGDNTDSKWSDQLEAALESPAAAVKTIPFVMLPSLSPYQQPPSLLRDVERDTDATLAASVYLGFSLPMVVPALGVFRKDQKAVAFAVGAPMFPEDDDQDGGG